MKNRNNNAIKIAGLIISKKKKTNKLIKCRDQ